VSRQTTIKNEVSVSGVGLHTGCEVQIVLKPSQPNTGIQFVRVDLPHRPVIKADPENILTENGVPRCTTIGVSDAVVHTVEHVMSVLCGLRIDNLIIELNERELPGLDGSGQEFLDIIKKTGMVEQDEDKKYFQVVDPIGIEHNGSSIYILPAEDYRISYTLDYKHPFLKSQFFSTNVTSDIYEQDVAPSRTFCLESEAKELVSNGLGKGANYSNTLVVGDNGVIENEVRFENEFARHKVLDLIGDLYLLGTPIKGHVFAVKSGHSLNVELLKKILKQKQWSEKKGVVSNYDLNGRKEVDINEIMKILPHRYPFLLVDRVVEIEKGKRAVGIKNVTINEHFFAGHFPTRPVMPGVLIVEAMAQTGGVTVLTNEAHHGKVAFFMAANNVKFRKVVQPGDQLIMEVEVVKDRSKIAQVAAKSFVNGEIVAEAEMIFSFTDANYLD